ncbi:hypothetical protein AVEN_233834-1 [Araneus ventricosus]|uniref:Uncharacterized protein n=1 Tax=Araneus ventricosus TaxID=182803 RepID=A0A4Y2H6I0_ARAVE|nr:hypothetical protein AVEN_233834-1 [Araneus ventricosus]
MLLIGVPILQPDPPDDFYPHLPVSILVTQCSLFERQDHKEFVNLTLIPKRHGSTPHHPRLGTPSAPQWSTPSLHSCLQKSTGLPLNSSRTEQKMTAGVWPPPLLVVNPKTAVGSREHSEGGMSNQ